MSILLNLFMSKNEAFPRNFTQQKFESLNDKHATSANEKKFKRNLNSFQNTLYKDDKNLNFKSKNVDFDKIRQFDSYNGPRYKETKVVRLEKQGYLSGIVREFPHSTKLDSVDQFLGIPYAEAPINSLRFMPPANPLPWNVNITFRANKMGPVCPQKLPDLSDPNGFSKGRYEQIKRLLPHLTPDKESEDCLYLNLYVRSDRKSGKSNKHTFTYDSLSCFVVI